ncbi:MAG TPA: phytanoyl-CoA dioxygenase family protein [Acidimicrobiales bacterium]|nr:phytanoyl-CoA dioxygenase family protein [Acidimicrobiales bacterium]
MLADVDVARFADAGFVVLRNVFDPAPLSHEVDRALNEGLTSRPGTGGDAFRYLPMMCERTPESLALLDTLARPAAQLLGRPVIPLRGKGTRYSGATAWHRDSEVDVDSIGCVAYLEPLRAGTGALRVVPGSHRDPSLGESLAEAIETVPGDVIAFDEHLLHASFGGVGRRQWRVDFLADPDAAEVARLRGYLATIFDPAWDSGYDAGRYPSYGAAWLRWPRPWVERLRELGVYTLAAAQEAAAAVRAHPEPPRLEKAGLVASDPADAALLCSRSRRPQPR